MRTLRIIASFDADCYEGVSNDAMCEILANELAGELAKIFKGVPSYISTTVEVVNSVVADEVSFDNKED